MSKDQRIRTSLLRRGALAALLAGGLLCSVTAASATETWFDPSHHRMPSGDGVFEVDSVSRGPVTIYTYRPQSASSTSPIWIVMPGMRRDAHRHLAFEYYDTWRPLADQYGAILLVPEFTSEKWPGAWAYNMGNVRSPNLRPKPWRQTSFHVVEEAFRLASRSLGGHRQKFSMFGHGAGAQFIQRYVMHSGCRFIDRAVAANSGWYMMPESDFRFPFGLGGAPIGDATLAKSFGCNLTLLLGTRDVNYARMRNDRDALRQGRTRYERGQFFYQRSRAVAASMGAAFNWRVREVPGVAHQADRMAPAGAAVLAGARVANSN